MEELTMCPKCGGLLFSPFLSCVDYTVSKEIFFITACNSCGIKFTNPRPDSKSISRYYESEDYISHSNTKTGIINKIYHFVRKIALQRKVNLINELNVNNKVLLDIGCGTGAFLGKAKEGGWDVSGIEPNDKARGIAIDEYSIPIHNEFKSGGFIKNSFSVITMWHVLEHMHDLKYNILNIKELVVGGGYLVVAVPNYTSWDAKHYKSFWAAYDVPRHLYHFSPDVIKSLFSEQKFKHIKSIPMKFDSYYVSLLSEKYKKSTFVYLSAFIKGWWSNFMAKKNAEKYSSVIYIFQKENPTSSR